MDYKYIEQLLDRYWEAETTVEEEQILRSFFRQSDIPEGLLRYKDLFAYEQAAGEEALGEDFDRKVLSRIEKPAVTVRARRITLMTSLRPLFQAAAGVAIVVLVGIGAQRAFDPDRTNAWDYNPASYQDTYSNEQQAYRVLEDGLEMFQKTAAVDTLKKQTPTDPNKTEK